MITGSGENNFIQSVTNNTPQKGILVGENLYIILDQKGLIKPQPLNGKETNYPHYNNHPIGIDPYMGIDDYKYI